MSGIGYEGAGMVDPRQPVSSTPLVEGRGAIEQLMAQAEKWHMAAREELQKARERAEQTEYELQYLRAAWAAINGEDRPEIAAKKLLDETTEARRWG